MARPTKYDRKLNRQVEQLARLGATEQEMTDFFGVDKATITRWKSKFPEFCTSLKRGKIVADAKVSDSLFKRANGYSHKAVKIFNNDGEPMIVPYVERYPPDTTAAIFWLKNRRWKVDPADGQPWRDRQEVGLELENLTDDQLDRLYNRVVDAALKTDGNGSTDKN